MTHAAKTLTYKFFCGSISSFILGIHLSRSRIFGPRITVFNFLRKQLHHLTFPPAVYEVSSFSTLLLGLCDYSQPSGCEVLFHCGFEWYFTDSYWYWASFHILTGQWCMYLLGEMSIQILSFLKIGFFVFLLSCKSCLF